MAKTLWKSVEHNETKAFLSPRENHGSLVLVSRHFLNIGPARIASVISGVSVNDPFCQVGTHTHTLSLSLSLFLLPSRVSNSIWKIDDEACLWFRPSIFQIHYRGRDRGWHPRNAQIALVISVHTDNGHYDRTYTRTAIWTIVSRFLFPTRERERESLERRRELSKLADRRRKKRLRRRRTPANCHEEDNY